MERQTVFTLSFIEFCILRMITGQAGCLPALLLVINIDILLFCASNFTCFININSIQPKTLHTFAYKCIHCHFNRQN